MIQNLSIFMAVDGITWELRRAQSVSPYKSFLTNLSKLPESSCDGNQFSCHVDDLIGETPILDVVAASNTAKDLVDGGVGGQGAVNDHKLSLQSLGDIITTSSRLDHGSQELETTNSFSNELPSFSPQ